jgi:hypothetical protein
MSVENKMKPKKEIIIAIDQEVAEEMVAIMEVGPLTPVEGVVLIELLKGLGRWRG